MRHGLTSGYFKTSCLLEGLPGAADVLRAISCEVHDALASAIGVHLRSVSSTLKGLMKCLKSMVKNKQKHQIKREKKPAPSSLHAHSLQLSQGLRMPLIAHRRSGRIRRASAAVRDAKAAGDAKAAAGSEVGGAAGAIHTSFASACKAWPYGHT